jgi:hypothetical protein
MRINIHMSRIGRPSESMQNFAPLTKGVKPRDLIAEKVGFGNLCKYLRKFPRIWKPGSLQGNRLQLGRHEQEILRRYKGWQGIEKLLEMPNLL